MLNLEKQLTIKRFNKSTNKGLVFLHKFHNKYHREPLKRQLKHGFNIRTIKILF